MKDSKSGISIRLVQQWDPAEDSIIDEYSPEVLHRRYYRWWTIQRWNYGGDMGMKLGPVTVYRYVWDGWRWGVTILGRTLFDTGLSALRKS